MKEQIRKWLGLTEIFDRQISIVMRLQKIHDMQEALQATLVEPINKLSTVLLDEHSSARKAASDMIGAEAMKRAEAERKARDMTVEGSEF